MSIFIEGAGAVRSPAYESCVFGENSGRGVYSGIALFSVVRAFVVGACSPPLSLFLAYAEERALSIERLSVPYAAAGPRAAISLVIDLTFNSLCVCLLQARAAVFRKSTESILFAVPTIDADVF